MEKTIEEVSLYTRDRLIYLEDLLCKRSMAGMSDREIRDLMIKSKRALSTAVIESGIKSVEVIGGEIIYPSILVEASEVMFTLHGISRERLCVQNKRKVASAARHAFIYVTAGIFMVDHPVVAMFIGRTRLSVGRSVGVAESLIYSKDCYLSVYDDFFRWARERKLELNDKTPTR